MFYCVFVTFHCGVLGQVLILIVSIPDLCLLTYFGKLITVVTKYAEEIMNKQQIINFGKMS